MDSNFQYASTEQRISRWVDRIAAGLTEARCASERGLANGRRAPRGAPLHGGRQRQIRGSVPSHGARPPAIAPRGAPPCGPPIAKSGRAKT